jgi:hypothetical protein
LSSTRALLLGWAALTTSCAELPDIAADTCGNGVVESREDCDTFPLHPNALCRPKGTAGECHFDCRPRNDGSRPACPAGWGCDVEGLCRAPTGEFENLVPIEVGGASSLLTGDFDGDGRADIVSREPLDAYGRSRFRFHYFDARGGLVETRLFPKLSASPAIADLSGDGRSDIVFSDFRVAMLLGQADRGLVPETFASHHVPRAKVRMLAVYDDIIRDDSALLAVTTLNGIDGYYSPDSTGSLLLRGKPPGPLEALAGDPVDGDVFDDTAISPCREVIAAARGATTFSIVDVCTRSTQTGAVEMREMGVTTIIALEPPAAIDTAPLVTDIDVDGHLDVLVGAAGRVYAARSDGHRLSAAAPYRIALANDDEIVPDIAMPLAAGDFTADGAPDFVFPDRLLTSSPVSNSPLPRYDIAQLNSGIAWTEAKIVDLNANGKLDVVAGSRGRLGVDFFNGTGTKHLTDFNIPTRGPVAHLAIADLDGDLINDLAFVETAPSASDRDTVSVSFGRLSGPPLAPAPIARVARTEALRAYTESARGNLIVSSAEGGEGDEGGVLTLLTGNGDRLPVASLGLSSISLEGHLVDAVALGLTVGSLATPNQHDLLALATTNFDARDWQVWFVPRLGQSASGPQRLDIKLDPNLLPAFSNGFEASLTWVGATADLDGDGRDEAVWVMSKVDHQHCAIVIIGAVPGTDTFAERATVDVDEPCARADLKLPDADGDGSNDIVLLTGPVGSGQRKLLILWNQGQGRFSASTALQLHPSTDSPEAFAYLPPIPARPTSIAYVTESSLVMVESTAPRRFTSRVLAPIVRGTGIVAADIDGDKADDLVVAASGNLFLMKARLRTP